MTLILEEKAEVLGDGRELIKLDLLVNLVYVLGVLRLHEGHRDTECIEWSQVGRRNEACSLELFLLIGKLLDFLRMEDSCLDQLLSLNRQSGTHLVNHFIASLHHVALCDHVDQIR